MIEVSAVLPLLVAEVPVPSAAVRFAAFVSESYCLNILTTLSIAGSILFRSRGNSPFKLFRSGKESVIGVLLQ